MAGKHLEGLAVVKEQLLQLGAIAGQKVMASALRAAMAPVLEEAQRLVPTHSGILKNSMRLATVKPSTGNIVASAGVAFSRKVEQEIPATLDEDESAVGDLTTTRSVAGGGWRYHFVEFGTIHQAAHPFLRPAMTSKHSEAAEGAANFLKKKVASALKRQNKAALAALTEEGYG